MAKKNPLPVDSPSSVSYKPSPSEVERERRYRAQDAIQTLQRAQEIKKDKSLMKDCKTYAREQVKTLGKI